MTIGLVFWILMLLWAVFSFPWPGSEQWPWRGWGNTLFLFILFLLLGWHAFGAPIRG